MNNNIILNTVSNFLVFAKVLQMFEVLNTAII